LGFEVQSLGFEVHGRESHVCRLKKAFYGQESLASEFEMHDIGLMHYFLGLKVWQEPGHIFLGQGKYVCDILSRFQMGDRRPMTTPMITKWKKLHASESQLVDSTLYH
jgi:hypothetical protein